MVPLIVAGSIITGAFGLLLLLEHTTSTGWVDWLVRRITPGELVSEPPGFFSPVSLEGTGAYLAVITMVGLVVLGTGGIPGARNAAIGRHSLGRRVVLAARGAPARGALLRRTGRA